MKRFTTNNTENQFFKENPQRIFHSFPFVPLCGLMFTKRWPHNDLYEPFILFSLLFLRRQSENYFHLSDCKFLMCVLFQCRKAFRWVLFKSLDLVDVSTSNSKLHNFLTFPTDVTKMPFSPPSNVFFLQTAQISGKIKRGHKIITANYQRN